MKVFLLLFMIIFSGCNEFSLKLAPAPVPYVPWTFPEFINLEADSNAFDANTDTRIFATQIDSKGNAYMLGAFSGSMSGVATQSEDLFLLKLDKNGTLQWKLHFNSSHPLISDSSGIEMPVDLVWDESSKFVYLAATTTGSLIETNSSGFSNIVLGKVSQNGEIQWLRHYGEETQNALRISLGNPALDWAGNSSPGSLHMSPQGHLLVTFETAVSLFETQAGDNDIGAMKINIYDGNIIQGRQLGVETLAAWGSLKGIAVDGSKREGVTQGRAAMDGSHLVIPSRTYGSLVDTNSTGTTNDAVYIVLNQNLELTELVQLGANTYADWVAEGNYTGSVALDNQFRSVVVLGPGDYLFYGKTSDSTAEAKSIQDLFFVRFLNGQITMIKQYGAVTLSIATNTEEPRHMIQDEKGDIYCVGHSRSGIWETKMGLFNPFIIKIDKDANILGAKQFGAESATTFNMVDNNYNLVQPGSFAIKDGRVLMSFYNSGVGSSGPWEAYLWSFKIP